MADNTTYESFEIETEQLEKKTTQVLRTGGVFLGIAAVSCIACAYKVQETFGRSAGASQILSLSIVQCTLVLAALTLATFSYRRLFQPLIHRLVVENSKAAQSNDEYLAKLDELTTQSAELNAKQHDLLHQLAENQQATENYRLAYNRFQKVLGSLPVPFIGCDTEGSVYEWNDAAETQFGYNQMELFERPLGEVILNESDRSIFSEKFKETIEKDTNVRFELPTLGKFHQSAMMEFSLTPIRGATGAISSILITCVDVTERIAEQRKLAELAYIDALTGLLNRRAFLQKLDELYTEVTASNPLSIILFDIDKFKSFNDSYGHPAGDQLLRRAGELLKEICGDNQIPGRYGGEEFIVLLPNQDLNDAVLLAERIREAFPIRTSDCNGGATSSFGVSCSDSPDLISSQELIQCADQGLYAAKRAGRNRVITAGNADDSAAA